SSFVLAVNPIHDPPVTSGHADPLPIEDTPTAAIPFYIGDVESTAGTLRVTGHSSNPGLVPDGNIVFGGSGPNRTVTLIPATNQSRSEERRVVRAAPDRTSAGQSLVGSVTPVRAPH